MFAAVDVHYPSSGGARAALVLTSDVAYSTIVLERTALVADVAPYQPGEFYRVPLENFALVPIDVGWRGRACSGSRQERQVVET